MTNLSPKQLDEVLQAIQRCKKKKTCLNLTCRGYYFEPNSKTINIWREKGLYTKGIDRRAMFVCESPGPSQKLPGNVINVNRCWSETPQDKRFLEVRDEYELSNCYITNAVKCGVRKGSRHTDKEILNCANFLKREIQIIKPSVVVVVGSNSEHILRNHHMDTLVSNHCQIFRITHYSTRRNPKIYWDKEFPMLLDLIKAKNCIKRYNKKKEFN